MKLTADELLEALYGTNLPTTIQERQCVFVALGCESPDFNFRDDLSKQEYQISGICQTCQDKTFVEGEDDYDD